MMTGNDIVVVCAAILRHGRLLCVRKQGTRLFMLPGGKPEPAEDDMAALRREVSEELGCGLRGGSARLLGRYAAPAANEAGCTVRASIYRAELSGEPHPRAEIAEARWIDIHDGRCGDLLAPLLRDRFIPALRRMTADGQAG
ncbi:NUDIX hydrolase [Novacetimonas pomaceti]|uniref:Nucleoside triphosphate hydrolase n=1 Tax=Novacetimonas pomaceti TaxID=2021998 RepID=A0ABX5P462_9PROT|nr:NUDIX domain-containing protein [Novacetimonas pomaceti]PYD47598.1 nucleoside triphosphate hydrolase [Novacetimonas pomaceti]